MPKFDRIILVVPEFLERGMSQQTTLDIVAWWHELSNIRHERIKEHVPRGNFYKVSWVSSWPAK